VVVSHDALRIISCNGLSESKMHVRRVSGRVTYMTHCLCINMLFFFDSPTLQLTDTDEDAQAIPSDGSHLHYLDPECIIIDSLCQPGRHTML
jgi:hypothetical protein